MTREEQIYEASIEYSENEIDKITSSNSLNSFISGAKWADNHPKSSWISVKEDLPYNHEELIDEEEFDQSDTEYVYVICKDGCDATDYMIKTGGEWKWGSGCDWDYWMPKPQLPKE